MIKIKRKGYLYNENYKFYKCIYISRVYDVLKNKQYVPGPYNRFIIYEPKKRLICSQGMLDKTINHLISRYILYPAILPCLIDENVASRMNLGTNAGLELRKYFNSVCRQQYNDEFYVLKCDISKFFYSINHDILKKKLKRRIKDKDALNIVFQIIDSEPEGLNIRFNDKSSLSYFLFK